MLVNASGCYRSDLNLSNRLFRWILTLLLASVSLQDYLYNVVPRGKTPSSTVLYIHGGGWLHEISFFHWKLIEQIAVDAQARVVVPIYALLPKGNASMANQLITGLAQSLIGRYGDVAIAGDSAGGQIALSAAQALRDYGISLSRLLLISPALDLGFTNPAIARVQSQDPWLRAEGCRELGKTVGR
jgi:acetyl esterase/lipase